MKKVPIPLSQSLAEFARGPLVFLVWLGAALTVAALLLSGPWPAEYVGWVAPNEFGVNAPADGTVAAVLVRPADRVRQGQLVAQLDPALLEAELETELAEVKELEARVEAAVLAATLLQAAELETARRDWLAEERRLSMDESDLALELLGLELELTTDRVEADRLGVRSRRAESMRGQGIGQAAEAEDLSLRLEQTRERIAGNERLAASVRERLAESRSRRAQWAGTTPAAGLRPTAEWDALRAAVRVQERRVRELELERGGLALKAPIDGQVVALYAAEGQAIEAGTALMLVTSEDANEVVFWVSEDSSAEALLGRRCSVRSRRRDGPIVAIQVSALGPRVEMLPDRLWRVPGQPVWGRAARATLPDGTGLIPGEALSVSAHD